MPKEQDPLAYDPTRDKASLPIPDVPVPKINSDVEAEMKLEELAGTVQPIEVPSLLNKEKNTFTRPRTRMPSYEECEVLGGLVAMGMPLEAACSLLTPPLRYEKVEKCLSTNFKRRTIFRRAQSKWLYNSLQLLLTRPPKEIAGLIFILKNRHSRLFDGGNRLKLDITSAGSPLQLTSPEVIERARLYAKSAPAQVIDVDTVPQLPLTASVDSNTNANVLVEKNTYPPPMSSVEMASTTDIKNSEPIGENDVSRSPTPPVENIKSVDVTPEPTIEERKAEYAKKKEARDAERAAAYLDSLINDPTSTSDE